MITNYKEYIKEAKQVGKLYHFTSLINLYWILKENCLRSYRNVESFDELMISYTLDEKSDWYYISFSRNKNLHKKDNLMLDTYLSSRITIDGDLLSEKYRIYPVNYFPEKDKTSSEAEECIVVDDKLPKLNKYILKIDIPSFDEFSKEFDILLSMDNGVDNLENICYELGVKGEFENYLENDEYEGELIQTLYDKLVENIKYDGILK